MVNDTILTVHVIPASGVIANYGGNDTNFSRLRESFGGIPCRFIEHTNHELWRLDNLCPVGRWWMYVYSNEWLSIDLRNALPTYLYLDYDQYEAYTLIKEVDINGSTRYFQSPRIFAKYIRLREGSLLPIGHDELRLTRVLDGVIEELPRE